MRRSAGCTHSLAQPLHHSMLAKNPVPLGCRHKGQGPFTTLHCLTSLCLNMRTWVTGDNRLGVKVDGLCPTKGNPLPLRLKLVQDTQHLEMTHCAACNATCRQIVLDTAALRIGLMQDSMLLWHVMEDCMKPWPGLLWQPTEMSRMMTVERQQKDLGALSLQLRDHPGVVTLIAGDQVGALQDQANHRGVCCKLGVPARVVPVEVLFQVLIHPCTSSRTTQWCSSACHTS